MFIKQLIKGYCDPTKITDSFLASQSDCHTWSGYYFKFHLKKYFSFPYFSYSNGDCTNTTLENDEYSKETFSSDSMCFEANLIISPYSWSGTAPVT